MSTDDLLANIEENREALEEAIGDRPMKPSPYAGVATITQIMSQLAEKGDVQGIETMARLWREEQDRAAAREFAHDFAEFQSDCPSIPKTSTANIVTKGGAKFSYSYSELDEIASVAGPKLHPRGFSFTWDCALENDVVTAICTLRHRNGHSISARFQAPVDAASSMNPTQRVAAALTYAKRQALVQVLGLTTTEPDTDVRQENIETIDAEEVANLRALLTDTKSDLGKFLAWVNRSSLEAMTQAEYRRALGVLEAKALEQRGKA